MWSFPNSVLANDSRETFWVFRSDFNNPVSRETFLTFLRGFAGALRWWIYCLWTHRRIQCHQLAMGFFGAFADTHMGSDLNTLVLSNQAIIISPANAGVEKLNDKLI